MTTEHEKDVAITEALMNLLEVKLEAFMGRADLSASPPEDKVAIRAAYFLGIAAGMQMANTITEPEDPKNLRGNENERQS